MNGPEGWHVGGQIITLAPPAKGTNCLRFTGYASQEIPTIPGRKYFIKFATKYVRPQVFWDTQELKNFVEVPGGSVSWYYLFCPSVTATRDRSALMFVNSGEDAYLDEVPVGWLEEPVQILQQPSSVGGIEGTSASFSVVAFGGPPISHQWFHNGTLLTNRTNAFLQIYPLMGQDAGAYWVVVSNVVNVITSSVATLTLEPPPQLPVIVLQPESDTFPAGYTYTMRVAAIGAGPLTFQWSLGARTF